MYIGTITTTHGIKGEVKILSKIKNKELVFKKDNVLTIDNDSLTINTYRVHKNLDMVTFKEINDINDVLKYKGHKVYFDESQIKEDVLFDEDYIGMEVFADKKIGIVTEVINNDYQDILVIDNKIMIPNVSEFVKKVDKKNNRIEVNLIKGLIDED